MLHTKFQGHRPFSSREELLRFLPYIWAWWPSWSCDQDSLNKLSFPHPREAPYEIWLWLAQWFQRRRCLKSVDDCWTDDGGRPTYPISSPVSLRLRWAKKSQLYICIHVVIKFLINISSGQLSTWENRTVQILGSTIFRVSVLRYLLKRACERSILYTATFLVSEIDSLSHVMRNPKKLCNWPNSHQTAQLHKPAGVLKWVTAQQNQQYGLCASKDSDQPGHRPIWSVFTVCSMGS